MNFYTYAYYRKDGTPYYVGKGRGRRAYKQGVNHHPPKDGVGLIDHSRIKIWPCAKEETSFAYERHMVRLYGRKDLGTGILRNLTDGGDGAFGASHPNPQKGKPLPDEWKANVRVAVNTEQWRQRASASHKGYVPRESTREKLREIMLANPRKPWEGKTLSPEHRAAISQGSKGKAKSTLSSCMRSLTHTMRGIKPSTEAAVKGGKVAGRLNSHVRWHVNRNVVSTRCPLCHPVNKENQ